MYFSYDLLCSLVFILCGGCGGVSLHVCMQARRGHQVPRSEGTGGCELPESC